MTPSKNNAVFVDRRYRSPNFNQRDTSDGRQAVIDMVIIHYTDMPSCQEAITRLCDTAAEVSAHYIINKQGKIFCLVEEHYRAWHAGVSVWQGACNINDRSIGIELDYPGHSCSPMGRLPPFPMLQIRTLVWLLQDILARHAIDPSRVLGHEDIAPGRKVDPGAQFPWSVLIEAGVARRQHTF